MKPDEKNHLLDETRREHEKWKNEKRREQTEVQPLRRQVNPAEQYPIESLGKKLDGAVAKVHAGVKAPLSLCAQSFLAGAAVCVQGIANLELHGGEVPLSEFFLTIGESGERKSAVDNIAKKPHADWQREEFRYYEADLKSYNDLKSIYDKERSLILGSKDEFKSVQLAALKEPVAPRIPLLFTEEPTFEGVFKLLTFNS